MQIATIAIENIIPYAKNIKDHPQSQIDAIRQSIAEFGFRQPIVIDKNNVIVAGHARYEAARQCSMQDIPCILADDLTPGQIKAYRILDNEIARQGSVNIDNLHLELAAIPDFDFAPYHVDFPMLEIASPNLAMDDDMPESNVNVITKTGDIWILGNHRLMCGDSTNPLDVDSLLDGKKPNLMVTDPPYGVNYDPSWRNGVDIGFGKRSTGKVANDNVNNWTNAYSLFPGNISYIWHAGKYSHLVAGNIEDCNFEIVSQIIWTKQHFVLSRGDYHWKHEPCIYAVRKGQNHNWNGARDQCTVWDIKNNNPFGNHEKEEKFDHGTQKPVECMLRPVLNNSSIGEYVYEPFSGSGTTMIACEKSGRKCLSMEIDPSYCDMAIRRFQNYTGKHAVHEQSQKTYEEIANG